MTKIILILFLTSFTGSILYGQYKIDNRVIGSGAYDASNNSYRIKGTIGQTGIDNMSNGTYSIQAGFWNTVSLENTPTVTTTTISNISFTTATGGGNVTNQGDAAVTARGVCWYTSTNPTTSNSHTSDGSSTGTFTSSITGLNASTLYHVRAYAINSVGTGYGSDITFTTVPTLPEWGFIALISLSAVVGGWFVWKRFA
jgi:hypothetical protein